VALPPADPSSGILSRSWHLSAWALANALFLVKYGTRVHLLLPFAGAVVIAIGLAAAIWTGRVLERRGGLAILPWFILALFLGSSAIGFHALPVSSIRVDRFDMIDLFWENLRSGIDPYTPRIPGVTSIPSQFPSYFLLAYPFHLVGEIGWISVLSIAAIGWILWRRADSPGNKAFAMALLLLSPALWWEILCRSTIFAGSVLCLVAMVPLLRRPTVAPGLLTALFLGLVTSTRSVVLQMIIPMALPLALRDPRRWIVPALTWCVIPVATIAPLLLLLGLRLWNPFEVNSMFLPAWIPVAILIGSTSVASLRSDWRWSLSVMLLGLDLLVVAYAGIVVHEAGWRAALFGSRLDISYFLIGSPFHLFLWATPKEGVCYSPTSSGPWAEFRESLRDQ